MNRSRIAKGSHSSKIKDREEITESKDIMNSGEGKELLKARGFAKRLSRRAFIEIKHCGEVKS